MITTIMENAVNLAGDLVALLTHDPDIQDKA